jgi:hypothetical protein
MWPNISMTKKKCLQKFKHSLYLKHTHTHTNGQWSIAYQNSYWSDPDIKKKKTGEKWKLKIISTGDFLGVLWSSPRTQWRERIHKWTALNSIHHPSYTPVSLQQASPQGCLQWYTGKRSMNTQLLPCHMYQYHRFPKEIHTWSSNLHKEAAAEKGVVTGWIYKQGWL